MYETPFTCGKPFLVFSEYFFLVITLFEAGLARFHIRERGFVINISSN